MSDDLIDVWSGSSLNTFLRCAKQWEYAYVYRYKRPPRLRMVMGTAAHYALEVDLAQKILSGEDLPEEIMLDAFSTSYDKEVVDSPDEPGETRGSRKDTGVKSVKYWRANVAKLITPDYVEEPISFVINGIPWTGTLDFADDQGVVGDHKFTGKTPSSADAYILNMVGYAIGYRKLTGLTESAVRLDHIVGLKTKQNYKPIASDGPVPDRAIIAFADIVGTAQRSVTAGVFPPTGLKSGACTWCGYRDICPAYKDSPLDMRADNEEELEVSLKKSLTVLDGGSNGGS